MPSRGLQKRRRHSAAFPGNHTQPPLGVLADQFRTVPGRPLEHRHRLIRPPVAQRHADVAEQPVAPGPRHGRVAVLAQEDLAGHPEQARGEVDERRVVQLAAGRIGGLAGRREEPVVPRTHLLADVAAVHPVADRGAEVDRYGSPELDGEVGDAARGVHDGGTVAVVAEKGAGGAGVEAAPAGAAVGLGERRRRFQRKVREQDAQKKVRPPARVYEHGVPAEPAEAGAHCELPFQNRSSVDVGAAPQGAARESLEAVGQGVQPVADYVVVVVAACVARDDGAGGVAGWRGGVASGIRVGDYERRPEAGKSAVEVGAASHRAGAGQVVHAAVEAGLKPAPEVGHVLALAPGDDAGHLEAEGAGFGEGLAGLQERYL